MHPSVGKEYILSLMMVDEIDLIRQDIGPDRITLIHLLFRFCICWSLDGLVCPPDTLPRSCDVFCFCG